MKTWLAVADWASALAVSKSNWYSHAFVVRQTPTNLHNSARYCHSHPSNSSPGIGKLHDRGPLKSSNNSFCNVYDTMKEECPGSWLHALNCAVKSWRSNSVKVHLIHWFKDWTERSRQGFEIYVNCQRDLCSETKVPLHNFCFFWRGTLKQVGFHKTSHTTYTVVPSCSFDVLSSPTTRAFVARGILSDWI